jgi:hypothetical protein
VQAEGKLYWTAVSSSPGEEPMPLLQPGPGHKRPGPSISGYGLEGRWRGCRALLTYLGVRDLKPERPVELPFPFVALAERLLHSLLGAGVGLLLRGWAAEAAP